MKTRTLAFLIPLMFILIACRADGTPTAQPEQPSTRETPTEVATIQGEPQELTCQEMGLPCSAAEADPQAMARAAQLHQELTTRMGEGESIDSLQTWLEGMEEVRMVLSSPVSLVFVLEGSLPFGIYDAVQAGGLSEPGAGSGSVGKVLASLRPPSLPLKDVVGDDTKRENEARKKRALILSPFEFEYTVPDVGQEAVQILGAIPDYKGQVTFLQNEQVGVDAFRGWTKYDLILYNGHGGTVKGKDNKTGNIVTTTFILTGDQQESCDSPDSDGSSAPVKPLPLGVFCTSVSVRVENIVGRPVDEYQNFLSIYPHFFTSEYSAGLDKALIIFNGCVTFASTFLPAHLSGKDGVFFGWDQNVLANFNPGVISSLLSELANGFPSKKAYEKVCGDGCVDTAGKGAKLQRYQAKDDLRIREVAMLLHPLTGKPLTDGDKILVYGYPGDGQVDELPFYIEVIAVDFNQISDYTIRFEVNGQEVNGSWPLDDPEAVEKWEATGADTYRILDRMVLPFDFQQDQPIKVTILVDLPEGGNSKSVLVKPLTRNPVLGLESHFSMEEDGMTLDSYVSAEVPLSLLEIKDQEVSFESLNQPGLLKYDAFDVTAPVCEVETKTYNGSIDVFKAVFPKDGFTNLKVPMPDTFTFTPKPEIREEILMSCAGTNVPVSSIFWWASFSILNEKRFTDEGIQIPSWSPGTGGIYAVFHAESEQPDLEGEFTLRIQEP